MQHRVRFPCCFPWISKLLLNFQIVPSGEPSGSVCPNQVFVLKQSLPGVVFRTVKPVPGTAPVLNRLRFPSSWAKKTITFQGFVDLKTKSVFLKGWQVIQCVSLSRLSWRGWHLSEHFFFILSLITYHFKANVGGSATTALRCILSRVTGFPRACWTQESLELVASAVPVAGRDFVLLTVPCQHWHEMKTPQTCHLPVSVDLELQIGFFYWLAILEEAGVSYIIVDTVDFAQHADFLRRNEDWFLTPLLNWHSWGHPSSWCLDRASSFP